MANLKKTPDEPYVCARCGAHTDCYQPPTWRSTDRWVIRAHKDPINNRSCFAGGKLRDGIEDAIRKHRDRLAAAGKSAGVE
jgi:hypothetical protein